MTIRVLAKEDIPAVAALFRRVHPEHRGSSSEACESYFREMLFENPWRDPQVPSWVAEESGRISGFYAVMARPMLFRGRPIRAAVGCQFMVDCGSWPTPGDTARRRCGDASSHATLRSFRSGTAGSSERARGPWSIPAMPTSWP